MTIDNNLEGLFKAIDPLNTELENRNATHADAIWSNVLASTQPTRHKRRRLSYIGAGSLATLATAAAVLVGTLPGTAPLSAAAAILHQAALADASSATLPTLAAGQYYYQEAQVSMVCQFAKAGGSSDNNWIAYVSKGTMQSWTSPNNAGQIVITPTPVNEGGSHFATPADEARWVSEGKPFVPCALANASNTMVGNPANANSQSSYGGFAASVSGYSGFGFILGIARQATPVYVNGIPISLILGGSQSAALNAGTNVTNLPSDVAQITAMLANGEINTDGSTSSTPQVCPVDAGTNAAPGCNTDQQLSLIEQLLQLPEASAKFGSVLYDILAQMPGATVAANTTDSFGNTGSTVTVPVGGSAAAISELQVVLDPNSGALLSSTALDRVAPDGTVSATYSPEAAISYGPISIVQSTGALPNATK
jgi:hypothetical protein